MLDDEIVDLGGEPEVYNELAELDQIADPQPSYMEQEPY
jgi:hypothetical protein